MLPPPLGWVVEGCLSYHCTYESGVGVLAYFELQGQSRGRVGTGIFSCSVSALQFFKKLGCFAFERARAH